MVNNFEFYTPTRVIFGKDTESRTGELVREYGGHKVLLHYGGKSAEKSGLLGRIRTSLDAAGIAYAELGGVVPNPHLSKVREGIELCKKEGVDFLLPVGGGSVIDSAKAIAYGLAEPDLDIWDLYDAKRIPKACFPIGVVLTLAASGSEMSNSSVITNEITGEKRGCNSNLCRPKFAVMNPVLTETLPDYQTQAGCTDIIMHTMERYFTNGGNMELTDAFAAGLIKTVMKNAKILHKDPKNYDARAEVMWAGSLSHNDITGCGNTGNDFMSHKLEHELGGMFDVTHGAGLAAVWPFWAKYVMKDCMPRFVKFAKDVMDVEEGPDDETTALKGIEAMTDFFRSIDMPVNIKELGIAPTDEQIKELADRCFKACGGPKGSAKLLDRDDMEAIYRAALS